MPSTEKLAGNFDIKLTMTGKGKRRGRKRGTLEDSSVYGGAAAGAEAASAEASASDALGQGLKQFLDDASHKSKMSPGQLKGFLFERLEAAKFNAAAARKGLAEKAWLTADTPGGGTDPRVDIEITRHGDVIQQIQAKSHDDPGHLARAISDPKYDGTARLVPSDKAERVNEILPEGKRVTGVLEQSGASSGGTTSEELRRATEDPRPYALTQEAVQVGREAVTTAAYAAIAGSVLGGAMSTIHNAYAYSQGRIDRQQAAKNIGDDATKSGVRSGAAAMLGTLIRYGAGKAGVRTLNKPGVAVAVAAGTIEAGIIIREYAKGEITEDAAAERLGQTAFTTVSGIYVGAAAGAMFGPVGAALGSVAGYLLAANVYQSCIDVLKESRLTGTKVEPVEALGYEAVRTMGAQRLEFEEELGDLLNEQQNTFDRYFDAVEQALLTDRTGDADQALGDLVATCGGRLQLETLDGLDKSGIE